MARYPAPVGGNAKEIPSLAVIPGYMFVEEAARTLPGKILAAIPDPHMVGNRVVILVAKMAASPVAMVRNLAVMVAENSVEKARGPDQTHISHTSAD